MIVADKVPDMAIVAYVPTNGNSVAACDVVAMFQREVVPHYFAPSTRQAALTGFAPAHARIEEPELESPNFAPGALAAFAARGFERQNRWSTGR